MSDEHANVVAATSAFATQLSALGLKGPFRVQLTHDDGAALADFAPASSSLTFGREQLDGPNVGRIEVAGVVFVWPEPLLDRMEEGLRK